MSQNTKNTKNKTKSSANYQKLSQREHVLVRPDTYVGSIELAKELMYVYDEELNLIIEKEINFVPGLLKIFDEIIVNARDASVNDTTCDTIKIECNQEEGFISVWNNGEHGIPVEIHPEHNVYVPYMIFGELMTSSNFDDNEKRTTGGRNGLGAKLTAIFSTRFIVEVGDADNKKKFYQEFNNNLLDKTKEKITKYNNKTSYVKITFYPDFEKFGIENLTLDHYQLFHRRCIDIAGTNNNNLKVYYNNKKLQINSFKKYIELYYPDDTIMLDEQDRWQVGVIYRQDEGNKSISFVNAISTYRGGKHDDHVIDQIIKKLIDNYIKKKNKDVKINSNFVKENLIFFINSIIENPGFSSQTKETLTTKVKDFGSSYTVSDTLLKKLSKSGIVTQVLKLAEFKQSTNLKKTDGKKQIKLRGIPKLEDANKAGSKDAYKCSLLLVEGDSAKTFAMSGLNVIGRDYFGIFPLKGKLLNTREASSSQIAKNDEITHIKQILGLKQGVDYSIEENFKQLRYGRIITLTDQDSVSEDTPLLLKNDNDEIEIRTIDDISENWNNLDGKEVSNTNFMVWTENGWTEIRKVIRHKVSKKMFRILTHTGIVDVTEDHSLLNMDGNEITPNSCDIGDKLLHNYPIFNDYKVKIPNNMDKLNIKKLKELAKKSNIYKYSTMNKQKLIESLNKYNNNKTIECKNYNNITPEEAYVMGLFFADGTCGIYKWKTKKKPVNRPNEYIFNRTSYSWSISNTNLDYLNKSLKILNNVYDYEFKIINDNHNILNRNNCNQAYKLILYGGKKSMEVINKYRKLFYSNKVKKIPIDILNGSYEIRKQFFNGYYDGDGVKTHRCGSKFFDVYTKLTSQCLYYLCKSLGYQVSINHQTRKPDVYTLNITKDKQQKEPHTIKKIIELGVTEQYVYDLETENHHFQAGIGEMIVHNTDGFHIKGLLMNMFHSTWKELVYRKDFITSLATPIVKLTKKLKKKEDKIIFYNLTDYENYVNNNNISGYKIKYYKGLGTSTSTEAKECFEDMMDKLIRYYDEETKTTDKCLSLAFEKSRADDRKEWLMNYDKDDVLDNNNKLITYGDFINKELKHFSFEDVFRSVPSMIDGFKPSQRKIFYGALLRGLEKDEVKVSQLAGFVSDKAAYHHGEDSLNKAIIGMAQNYKGSNNINVLKPNGQFGSINENGKDYASPRYIFTQMEDLTELIFRKVDNLILNYLEDDGIKIEPDYYLPIIPMCLVNGAKGVGTGFSTDCPNFNPLDIIDNLKRLLNEEKYKTLKPWYSLYNGDIKKVDKYNYNMTGVYKFKTTKTKDIMIVTELPIGTSTTSYKDFLDKELEKESNKKKKTDIKLLDYKNNCTDMRIYFELEFVSGYFEKIKDIDVFLKNYKLTKNIALTNLHFHDENNIIKKYNSSKEILYEFYNFRLNKYDERKKRQLEILKEELDLLSYKVKFILMVINKELKINNKKKLVLENELEELEFPRLSKNNETPSYNYLLSMPLWSLTKEKVDELQKQHDDKETEYKTLKKKEIEDIWYEELEELEEAYNKWYEDKINFFT